MNAQDRLLKALSATLIDDDGFKKLITPGYL